MSMRRKIHFAAFSILSLAILLDSGRCDATQVDTDPQVTQPPANDDSSTNQNRPVSGLATDVSKTVETEDPNQAVFVELILQISSTSIDENWIDEIPEGRPPAAFHLQKAGDRSVLYPLSGKPIPAQHPRLYVGVTVIDWSDRIPVIRRELYHDAAGRVTVDLSLPPDALPGPKAFTWPGPVEILNAENDLVSARYGGKKVSLNSDETLDLNDLKEEFDVDAILDQQSKSLNERGVQVPERDVLRAKLFASLAIREEIPKSFYQRLSVRNFGNVELAGFDSEYCWREALRAAEFGPYVDAEEMLELVLSAFPDHEQARDLLLLVADRIDRGVQPYRVAAKLTVPDSISSEQLQLLWDQFHEGTVVLTSLPETSGEEYATTIKDRHFEIGVPEGHYRMQVNVPGCALYEQELTVSSSVSLDVELKP